MYGTWYSISTAVKENEKRQMLISVKARLYYFKYGIQKKQGNTFSRTKVKVMVICWSIARSFIYIQVLGKLTVSKHDFT